jgi:hypothetical protein
MHLLPLFLFCQTLSKLIVTTIDLLCWHAFALCGEAPSSVMRHDPVLNINSAVSHCNHLSCPILQTHQLHCSHCQSGTHCYGCCYLLSGPRPGDATASCSCSDAHYILSGAYTSYILDNQLSWAAKEAARNSPPTIPASLFAMAGNAGRYQPSPPR